MGMIDDPESIDSDSAKAFDRLIDIILIGGCEIVIPSQMVDKLKKRFKEEHQASFFSHVDIDNSTKGTEGYDSYNSLSMVSSKKSKES